MPNTTTHRLAGSSDPIRVSISEDTYVSKREDRHGWEHREFTVRVSFQGRYALFPYSVGMAAGWADPRDFLNSLALDMCYWGQSVEDFAADYGYDNIEDARYVKRVIDREYDKLKRVFGIKFNAFVNTYREL